MRRTDLYCDYLKFIMFPRTAWNVYRVSPLWNLKFKKTKDKQLSLDESGTEITKITGRMIYS